jgi:hypothetical protein
MMTISSRSSLVRQLAWALTLATAFGTVWLVLVLWLITSILGPGPGGRRNWPEREYLVARSDGTVLISLTKWDKFSQGDISYRDLKGDAQKSPERSELLPAITIAGEYPRADDVADEPGWEGRLRHFVDDRDPNANWFFVHDGKADGAGYFVGYRRDSRRRIGFIGLSGARPEPVPETDKIPVPRFFLSYRSTWSSSPFWATTDLSWRPGFRPGRFDLPPRFVYIPSGTQLREVDLSTQTIATVFEAPQPIEAVGVPTVTSWSGGEPIREQPVLVRTRQQILALDRQHKVVRQFTIPQEISPETAASWYELADGKAIVEFNMPRAPGESQSTNRSFVYRIAGDGGIVERTEVTLKSGTLASNEADTQMLMFLALPAPALLTIVEPLSLMSSDRSLRYPAALAASIKQSWPSLLGAIAVSSFLGLIAWRRAMSFGLPKREQVAWLAFVFLLGLPAFAGFLLSRRWVVRQPCTTCHALAPRDRPECVKCGTRFPDPALKGIEIFA